ncbi:SEC-C domain-containing protein [Priestia filamentosa]|uniref:SEC-C domain-containing protein n=1 Tax=Priestia filamentosa TaxID=1402861 RepID=UPI00397D7D17
MNKDSLQVEVNVDAENGDLYIKTIGQTLSNEMFSKLAKEIKEQNKNIPGQGRVITLVNGQKKTCASLVYYQNTGMKLINFDDEHTVFENFGVVLESNEVDSVDKLYIDPKLMKAHYDKGTFNDILYKEIGLIDGEDEENLRKIETYVRLMQKDAETQEQQVELHLQTAMFLGMFSFYFGEMLLENAPQSKWSLTKLNETNLIIETIEGAKFEIDPLVLFHNIYAGSGVSVVNVWEKLVSLAGTELSPLVVDMMNKGLEKEEAIKILQDTLGTYFEQGAAPTKKDYSKEGIGRNDLCPCGSGDKYKKCCMNASASKANKKQVKYHEQDHYAGGNTTIAYTEDENGSIIVLGKHYSKSGLCYWKPNEIRHTIEDVEEWKKMVEADALLYLGIIK